MLVFLIVVPSLVREEKRYLLGTHCVPGTKLGAYNLTEWGAKGVV